MISSSQFTVRFSSNLMMGSQKCTKFMECPLPIFIIIINLTQKGYFPYLRLLLIDSNLCQLHNDITIINMSGHKLRTTYIGIQLYQE